MQHELEVTTDEYHDPEGSAINLLNAVLSKKRYGKFALVSSFGAESAVLLHLVARVKADTPVIFLDTNMLFQETLEYQLALTAEFGLTDVRRITPKAGHIRQNDAFGRLNVQETDRCCAVRKVAPLQEALKEFDGWITGRKRQQSTSRQSMPLVEGDRKVNPLAYWSRDDVEMYFSTHNLPRHPLVAQGFGSIGCAPCTTTSIGEDPRSGRWATSSKTECGIHFGEDGKVIRPAA